ncbi:ParA family protein [Bacillus sp. FSL K6-6483]|uniref:ParA family protein n=1 Tax=Shouchella tritolerans TaxID=2979466 RepID=UPI001B2C65AB|nr:ParA family protein [Shouchella tritolerans]GIN12523.1 ATPase [Shouchella clausii]
MKNYIFWNNKGGTGKTSLAFQSICSFADKYQSKRILAIDLCPQANLSELFLGGLIGKGGKNLQSLHNSNPRRSIGGYFEQRLPSPFSLPNIKEKEYICHPKDYNELIPNNVDLLAGDQIVELQSNAIATLANTQIPGTNTFLNVIDWLTDFIELSSENYDYCFIDANPSFSIYTQIALSAADNLIIPVMADDSSRRAVMNMFALVHNINVSSNINYDSFTFPSKLTSAGRKLPKVHLIVKNRQTQYMGPASAYSSVLRFIDNDINSILFTNKNIFTFDSLDNGIVDIKDFGTTGVVAFAEGAPLSKVRVGKHLIEDKEVQVRKDYLNKCIEQIDELVMKL